MILSIYILLIDCDRKEGGQSDKPNIILFLVDDMGLMDTSVLLLNDSTGHPARYPLNEWFRTPNMEILSKQGVRFSSFYAHSVCSPSRVSVMTGQNSARHRVTNWINPYWKNEEKHDPPDWNWKGLSENDITLPRLLNDVGYRNIFIGKAHFAPFEHLGQDPLNLGFDLNVAGSAIGHPGSYYGLDGFGHIRGQKHQAVPHLENYHHQDIYLTEALTREAIAHIDSAVYTDEPFFLYMSHYAVHWPFQPDKRFVNNYANAECSEDAKGFASMIEGIDKSLGDLMKHLKDNNIADNTLIFFLGDNGSDSPLGGNNGIASSAPLRGKKGSKWEGGTRVPFIAAWGEDNPDNYWQKKIPIKAGIVQKGIGACFDIFPTITELLDIHIPEQHMIDGTSLSKLFAQHSDSSRKDVFLAHYPHSRNDNYFTSYRKGKWKLIYHYFPELNGKTHHYELYDLETDRAESNDLARQEKDVVKQLFEEMKEDLNAKNALYPIDSLGYEVRPEWQNFQ